MFRDEDLIAIVRRKHRAGVEAHAERRHVRPKFLDWRNGALTIARSAKLWIDNIAAMAARKAEIETSGGRVIQFISGNVITHVVASIVGEP